MQKPDSEATLLPTIQEEVRRVAKRPHRVVTHPMAGVDLHLITEVTTSMAVFNIQLAGLVKHTHA